MCVRVCSLLYSISEGPVHMCGARPHQVWRWKEPYAICVWKAKIVMNILFHGCLSRSELQFVARKQALGFNKAEQLLICFSGTDWDGKGQLERTSWHLRNNWGRSCVPMDKHLIGCGECINVEELRKPDKDWVWNTIRNCNLLERALI